MFLLCGPLEGLGPLAFIIDFSLEDLPLEVAQRRKDVLVLSLPTERRSVYCKVPSAPCNDHTSFVVQVLKF